MEERGRERFLQPPNELNLNHQGHPVDSFALLGRSRQVTEHKAKNNWPQIRADHADKNSAIHLR